MKELVLTQDIEDRLIRIRMPSKTIHYVGEDLLSDKKSPTIAVVGTRKPTAYGIHCTTKLIDGLKNANATIISGLALGIDALAHETALAVGLKTIAVLPSGLSTIAPTTNEQLARRIVQSGGMLLSEYGDRHTPRRYDYLERNRLIAACADLVIIPEAAAKSGSLNTASHAHAMGIPVGVVPGSLLHPMSSGTNELLKSYGICITSADDITALLGVQTTTMQRSLFISTDEKEIAVYTALKAGNSTTEELLEATNLQLSSLQITLTMLELQGVCSCDSAGAWHLVSL